MNKNSEDNNLGWLFYRDYYENVPNATFSDEGKLADNFFDRKSEAILGFQHSTGGGHFSAVGTQWFQLTTVYPGLLMGSGYTHGTGTQGEFKLGFFFDHTTGLPVLPGSSVKGVLRSAFPSAEKNSTKQLAKAKFIWELLGKSGDVDMDFVKNLETQIFGATNGNSETEKGRDIFHDAFICAPKSGKIMGDDYITPHTDGPLKNPIPVRFLKILPDVTFQFPFDLKDSKIDEIEVTADQKLMLFLQILEHLGVGAKSNVGYGRGKLTAMTATITAVHDTHVEMLCKDRKILKRTDQTVKAGEVWEVEVKENGKKFELKRKIR